MQLQPKIIILASPKHELQLDDGKIIFDIEGRRSFYQYDKLITKEKEFADFIDKEMSDAQDIDHFLFAFLSNKAEAAREDPFFSSFVRRDKNIFSFRVSAFEDVQYVQSYATGQDLLDERVVNYPYYLRTLREMTRVTSVYINGWPDESNPSALTIFAANCQNVLFRSTQDPLFSQVSRLFILIDVRSAENMALSEEYMRKMARMLAKYKGELLIHRTIRVKGDVSDSFSDALLLRVPFNSLRTRIQAIAKPAAAVSKLRRLSLLHSAMQLLCDMAPARKELAPEATPGIQSPLVSQSAETKASTPSVLEPFRVLRPLSGTKKYREIIAQFEYELTSQKNSQPPPGSPALHMARSTREKEREAALGLTPEQLEAGLVKYGNMQQKYKNFSRFTQMLLRELKPIIMHPNPPPYPLYLNTYNLLNTNVLNGIGLGFFHSAIEILGVEIAYGGHQYDETGVYAIRPRSLAAAQFHQQILIDQCNLQPEQICDAFLESAIQWRGNMYDMVHYNCNDYTNAMTQALVARDIPAFVNRAARVAKPFTKRRGAMPEQFQDVIARQEQREANDEGAVKRREDFIV